MAIPKITYELLYALAIAVLSVGRWMETGTAAGVCTLTFLVAAFITDQRQKNPDCPSSLKKEGSCKAGRTYLCFCGQGC